MAQVSSQVWAMTIPPEELTLNELIEWRKNWVLFRRERVVRPYETAYWEGAFTSKVCEKAAIENINCTDLLYFIETEATNRASKESS